MLSFRFILYTLKLSQSLRKAKKTKEEINDKMRYIFLTDNLIRLMVFYRFNLFSTLKFVSEEEAIEYKEMSYILYFNST